MYFRLEFGPLTPVKYLLIWRRVYKSRRSCQSNWFRCLIYHRIKISFLRDEPRKVIDQKWRTNVKISPAWRKLEKLRPFQFMVAQMFQISIGTFRQIFSRLGIFQIFCRTLNAFKQQVFALKIKGTIISSKPKCSRNVAKMQSKYVQNAIKI